MSKLKFHSTKYRMSDIILKLFLLLMVSLSSLRLHAQYVALKSNLLYDALCIPSLGTEVRLDSTLTLSLSSTYCPISYDGDRKWKNWSVQYEARHWFRKVFNGPFVGICGINGGFNISRVLFSVFPITAPKVTSMVPDSLSGGTGFSLPTGVSRHPSLLATSICATAITVKVATATMNIQRARTTSVLWDFRCHWST